MNDYKVHLCVLCLIVCVVFGEGAVFAQGAGTTGASFLRIRAGARASSMGGAFTAVSNDAYGAFWNPAGISRLNGTTFSGTHQNQILDINNQIIGFGYPISPSQTFSFTGRFISSEDQVRTERESQRTFTNFDAAVGLNYAYGGRTGLAWGVGLKGIRSKLAQFTATSYALDMGLHYQSPRTPLRLGASIQNIGNDLTFIRVGDPLPRTFRAGWAYDFLVWNRHWVISNDIIYFQPEKRTSIAFGTEYALFDFMDLRLGMTTNQDFSSGAKFNAGLGFEIFGLKLDYAFTERSTLENLNRFSLSVDWGNRRKPESFLDAPVDVPDKPGPMTTQEQQFISGLKKEIPRELAYPDDKIDQWNKKAQDKLDNQKYKQAIDLWKKSLKADPNQRALYSNIATSYYKLGRFDKASEYFRKRAQKAEVEKDVLGEAMVLEKGSKESLNQRAQAAFKNGKYERAVKYWQRSLDKDPTQISVYRKLGTAFYELEKFKRAKKYIDEYINRKRR